MQVILIGAGRYGNGLVGKKHKEGVFNTKLDAVVDTKSMKSLPKKITI